MASIEVHITSDRFKSVLAEGSQRLDAALFQEATEIMADSKANYVPVVTGTLRASGYVKPPNANHEVELGYGAAGSGASAYARAVHEAPPEFGQGKNKYLEQPVLIASRGMESRIGKRMKEL